VRGKEKGGRKREKEKRGKRKGGEETA